MTPTQITMYSIKVGIYNIHGGVGVDGRLDIPRIARVLKTASPDIVGLNEVNRYSTGDDHVQEIVEELGADWTGVFGKTINKPLCEYGNAIVTRLPVVSSESWLLTDYNNQERRGMVRVTVRKDEDLIHVFCIHMGLKDEMRSRHIAEAQLIMSRFNNAPRILLGDFNQGRGSAGVDAIAKQFTDVWAAYGIGQGKTFPSVAPLRRIDFIWIDKELAATSCYVAGFPEANTASDHLPLFARLIRPADPQPTLRDISVRLNGNEVLRSVAISPPSSTRRATVNTGNQITASAGTGAYDVAYNNVAVKVLRPMYRQLLTDTPPGQAPPEWIQFQRSAGVSPFGGVALVGNRKLWRQRSEQGLSYRHALKTSASLTDFEVSARIKTIATGGGAWMLGTDTSSSRSAGHGYRIEVSHDARQLPRLRLMVAECELDTAALSDFQIDPYDWNQYALAQTDELTGDGKTAKLLTVFVNGRRIAGAADALVSRLVHDDEAASSIVLGTQGRHDAACEIYAENIMVSQWTAAGEPIHGKQREAVDNYKSVSKSGVGAAPEESGTVSSGAFETDSISIAANIAADILEGAGWEMGLWLELQDGVRSGERFTLLVKYGEDQTTLSLRHDGLVLDEVSMSSSDAATLIGSNRFEITMRSFQPDVSIIESHFKPPTRWRGFF